MRNKCKSHSNHPETIEQLVRACRNSWQAITKTIDFEGKSSESIENQQPQSKILRLSTKKASHNYSKTNQFMYKALECMKETISSDDFQQKAKLTGNRRDDLESTEIGSSSAQNIHLLQFAMISRDFLKYRRSRRRLFHSILNAAPMPVGWPTRPEISKMHFVDFRFGREFEGGASSIGLDFCWNGRRFSMIFRVYLIQAPGSTKGGG